MDPRRAQLARMLQRRRRRFRLLMVCLATAVTCGTVAGFLGPRILIGGTGAMRPVGQAASETSADARSPATPLDLPSRLALDPREAQANAIRWQKMSQAERRRLLDRYWNLAGLDAEQRESLLERYEAFRDLPQERRAFLRDRAARLKAFVATLSPQDQAVLDGMSDEARARRLLELWEARYGTW